MSSVLAAARPKTLPAAVPMAAWLAGLVALSAVVRYGVGTRMPGPWIMVDEIIYSELARSIASSGELLLRGEPAGLAYGVVYPALISPAYLLDSLTAAYQAAKAINAVLISLAAVPAYLLARRVLTPANALMVSLLTLAIPSLFYAGTIMTENAFYPIVLAAALALVTALERPTPLRVALFLAVTGIAFLTRAQAVFLLPAALTAPLLLAAWSRRLRTVLDFRWLYAGVAAAGLAVVVGAVARGAAPLAALGAYRSATGESYSVGQIGRWLLYHVAELDLYLGVAPFAAVVLLLLQPGRLERHEQVFLAAVAALGTWLVLQVAAFATQPAIQRVEERNMFYVAPLAFAALLLWIQRGAPRPRLPLALAAGAAALLPVVLPYRRLIDVSAVSDTFAMLPLWTIHSWGIPRGWVWLVAGGLAAALALLVAFLPRGALSALPVVLLALYAAASQPVDSRTAAASSGSLSQGVGRSERDWVDRAAGRDADVAFLWTGRLDRLAVHQNEFFSRSVRRIYWTERPVPGGLAQAPAWIDWRDGIVRTIGLHEVAPSYLLTDLQLPLEAEVAARDRERGLVLYRLEGPAGIVKVVRGVFPDRWSRPAFTYTGFRCDGDTLVARLHSDDKLFTGPQTVTAELGGRVVARVQVPQRTAETPMRVPLRGSRCDVRFTVTPTAVPAEVRAGSSDTRELGIRVLGFEQR